MAFRLQPEQFDDDDQDAQPDSEDVDAQIRLLMEQVKKLQLRQKHHQPADRKQDVRHGQVRSAPRDQADRNAGMDEEDDGYEEEDQQQGFE